MDLFNREPAIYSIKDFEAGIEKGLYSDRLGKAYLIIDGIIHSNYSVCIDRKMIVCTGKIVTFAGLRKERSNNIEIKYEPRPLEEFLIAFKQQKRSA